MANIIPFSQVTMSHLDEVGGKNSSLGEMMHHLTQSGVKVPDGFATTATAFHQFLSENHLDEKIEEAIRELDTHNLSQLSETGKKIRGWILNVPFNASLEQDIRQAFQLLQNHKDVTVAVRSSATAEDLPDASFAGQQETLLNVKGIDAVLIAIKRIFASLYTDRAISYRADKGFSEQKVALSVGIQRMVRSDCGASGVAFSIDTESGFDQVVLINASYGLGEAVVSGAVNPDEFYVHKNNLIAGRPAILRRNLGEKACQIVYKEATEQDGHSYVKTIPVEESKRPLFCITDKDIEEIARLVINIERHYGRPMDVEWAKDGLDGQIYILQARPETVKSHSQGQTNEQFLLLERGEIKAEGRSIGQKIGQGPARRISSINDMHRMQKGDVLVTDMTDPDWEPIMKIASGIVTNRGGRTCHAAIIARELGIPAVVGCGNATEQINDDDPITVCCAEGDTGFVYKGLLKYKKQTVEVANMPKLPFNIYLNLGNPEKAFSYQSIPNGGVGLARLEFIISNMIGIHPRALLNFNSLNKELQQEITKKTAAYASPIEYYIERLREGIATIAAAFYPKPVIVRLSDFKSNEYANLLGGREFEPEEENPMIGFRGASRYISSEFEDCFALECAALKRVRDDMAFTNVQVMIPFVRTVNEVKLTIEVLKKYGLKRGENDLKLIMMCEIPSNALLAEQFLEYVDGFSIGSNDLTQLTLGLDRDSSLVAGTFDERNDAVKALLHLAIQACLKKNKYIGICGQGPSDYPDFAQWLMKEGIHSISLSPDSVVKTWLYLAENL